MNGHSRYYTVLQCTAQYCPLSCAVQGQRGEWALVGEARRDAPISLCCGRYPAMGSFCLVFGTPPSPCKAVSFCVIVHTLPQVWGAPVSPHCGVRVLAWWCVCACPAPGLGSPSSLSAWSAGSSAPTACSASATRGCPTPSASMACARCATPTSPAHRSSTSPDGRSSQVRPGLAPVLLLCASCAGNAAL